MSKRVVALLCVFALLFTSLAGRCAYVALSETYQVSDGYNSYSLNISTLSANIYDRKGEKLNNNTTSFVALIAPDEKCLSELELLFDSDEIAEITDELSDGYPIIKDVDKTADTKYIKIVEKINQNSGDMLCRQLLDYRCSGLEAYIDDEIGSLYVNYPVDASGRLLNTDGCEIVDDNYSSSDGVVISIDSEVQKICESAAKSIEKGAVVVMDVENSRLLASVSMGGDYNNRALSHYAIGSVFKLVVCACALENGVSAAYNCTGSITVGDTVYSCQNNHVHGLQNMKKALANSCNCYFVNLALKLGKEKLYSTAESLGFGSVFELYDTWFVSSGNLPNLSSLSSLGQLALLGFGQGQLTDSPVHFASVVSCFANGGNYSFPTLAVTDVAENRVVSEKTADTLVEYMHFVVTNGTGANADYNNETGGKTATAQSGVYENGTEVLNTWFAGLYPVSDPKYAIVVMCEDGSSGAGDCCPVFRTIVENLENM